MVAFSEEVGSSESEISVCRWVSVDGAKIAGSCRFVTRSVLEGGLGSERGGMLERSIDMGALLRRGDGTCDVEDAEDVRDRGGVFGSVAATAGEVFVASIFCVS